MHRAPARLVSKMTGASDLWLENKAGVVMHLTGKQTGVTLSRGRDEILIEMAR